jgi:hypothetical protein
MMAAAANIIRIIFGSAFSERRDSSVRGRRPPVAVRRDSVRLGPLVSHADQVAKSALLVFDLAQAALDLGRVSCRARSRYRHRRLSRTRLNVAKCLRFSRWFKSSSDRNSLLTTWLEFGVLPRPTGLRLAQASCGAASHARRLSRSKRRPLRQKLKESRRAVPRLLPWPGLGRFGFVKPPKVRKARHAVFR